MTTIHKFSPADPRHPIGSILRNHTPSKNRNVSSILYGAIEAGKPYGEAVVGNVKGIAQVVFGFLGVVGGAIAAAVFEKGTAADWGSKAFMILGLVLGIFGIKEITKTNKKLSEGTPPEPHKQKVQDATVAGAVKSAWKEVVTLDPQFKKPIGLGNGGLIYSNTSNTALRAKVIELINKYTDPKVKQILESNDGGSESVITNISEEPVSLSDYRDKVALLLGYSVATRPDDTSLPPEFNDILTVGEIKESSAQLLPKDFVEVFRFARWYNNVHLNNDNSLNDITHNDKIDLIKKLLPGQVGNVEGTTKDAVKNYLNEFQNTDNYLKILEKIITYVMDPNNISDPTKARSIAIARQALICGFKLKCSNTNELNQALKTILNGTETPPHKGLKAKIKALDDFLNKNEVHGTIENEHFPFSRETSALGDSEISRGLYLSEFAEK